LKRDCRPDPQIVTVKIGGNKVLAARESPVFRSYFGSR
jgi:hypothetical protein